MSKWAEVKDVPDRRELYCACLNAASLRLIADFPATDPTTGMRRHPTPTTQAAAGVVELADAIYEAVIGVQ
ncbi:MULTISPECIES: hypothetical protein [Streptomyces]|uniref:Uncharacterized protein n=2 Tax=Streptomyces TaxID=1883 RepID=A0A2U9P063_STRAS|nr:hypothetical protein [Streptomyces actuosus]AWT42588.1 hypothetical protein DMT42_09860 [Streptomyces actuosus]MBM4819799.1 hypothetical protein [Streptomyces actuosus]